MNLKSLGKMGFEAITILRKWDMAYTCRTVHVAFGSSGFGIVAYRPLVGNCRYLEAKNLRSTLPSIELPSA